MYGQPKGQCAARRSGKTNSSRYTCSSCRCNIRGGSRSAHGRDGVWEHLAILRLRGSCGPLGTSVVTPGGSSSCSLSIWCPMSYNVLPSRCPANLRLPCLLRYYVPVIENRFTNWLYPGQSLVMGLCTCNIPDLRKFLLHYFLLDTVLFF